MGLSNSVRSLYIAISGLQKGELCPHLLAKVPFLFSEDDRDCIGHTKPLAFGPLTHATAMASCVSFYLF